MYFGPPTFEAHKICRARNSLTGLTAHKDMLGPKWSAGRVRGRNGLRNWCVGRTLVAPVRFWRWQRHPGEALFRLAMERRHRLQRPSPPHSGNQVVTNTIKHSKLSRSPPVFISPPGFSGKGALGPGTQSAPTEIMGHNAEIRNQVDGQND